MRKICVVTSTRAEYGVMSNLIGKLYKDKDIDLQLIATGMHLSKKFGYTYKEIKTPITKKIDIDIENTPEIALSNAVKKFSNLFKTNKADIVVLLGDRYEIMGVAQACMFNNIPIAHLCGGDTTQGAIDEAIRHSITKMSHLHFVTCEEAKNRVIQLGENPNRVFNFGDLSIENIKNMDFMSKKQLEESLNFRFNKKNLLATFHPVTLEGNVKKQFEELLKAFEELNDTNIIMTCPNSDTGNEEIFKLIKEYEKTHSNFKSFVSLGMIRYLSCMKYVDMVIGNSSSGIYEAPSFKIPTINIGNRQKGRLQAKSTVNCNPIKEDILYAISQGYNLNCADITNPYEGINSSDRIIKTLKKYDLNGIIKKQFYDIQYEG